MNYYRFPATQTAHYYGSVKSIKATDRYTVVVTLKHPDASWPLITAFAAMIFEKRFQDAHKTTMGQPSALPVGTGPWKIDSLDPTSGIEYSANPYYWGGKPPVQRISIKFFADETSAALAFRAGALDVDPAVTDPRSFSSSAGGAKIVSKPNCGDHFYSLNTHTGPFADVHVRRAFAYATNIKGIIAASGSPGTPMTNLLPPITLASLGTAAQVKAALKDVPVYPFSIAKARAELLKSAYPHGFSFTIDSYGGPTDNELQVLQSDLAKIGVAMKINDEPIGAWLNEVFGPRDKIPMIYTNVGCASADPSFLINLLLPSKQAKPGALNIADYTNPTVDSLIQQGLATSNKGKRLAIYARLLKQVSADVPYVGVYAPDANMAIDSKFSWSDFNAYWYLNTWALGIKPN
jgi:peptide/nickel transport system substrate-binding protein